MSKKLRRIVLFSLIGAVILAAGIYSLVTFLDYNSYRQAAEEAARLEAERKAAEEAAKNAVLLFN